MRLSVVVKKLVSFLLTDDWCRCPTNTGEYYVLGVQAYINEVRRGEPVGPFADVTEWPSADVGEPYQPEPLSEWYTRAQLAGRQRDYLKASATRLVKAGVPRESIERYRESQFSDSDATRFLDEALSAFKESVPLATKLRLLVDFVQACRIARGDALDLVHASDTAVRDISKDREKLCLKELGERYAKMVDRWEKLNEVGLPPNSQLQEASRSYLYGLYRASILLSTATLETYLKQLAGTDWIDDYNSLIEKACAAGLSSEHATWCREVFRKRNPVAHEGEDAKRDLAFEVLSVVKKILAEHNAAHT